MTFMEAYRLGKVEYRDVDDYIEQWHNSDEDISLSEYLGMTQAEYNVFMLDPDKLFMI